jgi:hypothetical protein
MKLRRVLNAVERWKLVTYTVSGIGKKERVFGRCIEAVDFTVLLARNVVIWSFILIRRCLGCQ